MERSYKKHSINIIDILIGAIILIAAALLAYIFFFNGSSEAPAANYVDVEFTVQVRNERDELVDNALANLGKTLVEGAAKYNLGTVIDIKAETTKFASTNMSDGSATSSDYPEHSDIDFIVQAQAVKNPYTGRYSINGFDISVGTLVYIRLPEYAGTGYCTAIGEIAE